MKDYLTSGSPGTSELLFLPLGGAGEIGMNLNLYGHDGAWLMVDLGVSFGEDYIPGIDAVMPDPSFIVERRDSLSGLVLTHAHEDHLGAVPHLWPELQCPVYATSFAASMLRRKLYEFGLEDKVSLIEVPLSSQFDVGPFGIELISLTHSIPEPNALVIRTSVGAVMHTGDWKFDDDPVVGEPSDEEALRRAGDDGILAMVCDSTNALVSGSSGSEGALVDHLQDLISGLDKRVAVGCFASNVARLQTIAQVAQNCDREVVLVGRSLHRMNEIARENGIFDNLASFVSEEEGGYLPRDKVLYICTGSQGEPRAALARIARGDHREVKLELGDAVIFSSRVIPGNELEISRLQNKFLSDGIDVITADDADIHVSGHPACDELAEMYQFIRPEIAIPVHGEIRHLIAHQKIAEACQVPHTVLAPNGSLVRLDVAGPQIIDQVPTGRLGVDGHRLVELDSFPMRERRRLQATGAVAVTVILKRRGKLATEPEVSSFGLIDEDKEEHIIFDAIDAATYAIEHLSKRQRDRDEAIIEAVKRDVRQVFRRALGKKPIIHVHLIYI
ncbi:MAG: MBL fold hydrolase [Rhodospirillaceae bacterium]|nr:MBL fold hydrolase [Rhodospirillaceae bacterium]